jgi:hypothetical protein
MTTCRNAFASSTRRGVLQNAAAGFGWLAFAALHARWSAANEPASYRSPLAPKEPHHAPRAKRVIFLFMNGGPSHHESFDWKPELARAAAGRSNYLAPAFSFAPAGRSGDDLRGLPAPRAAGR